ncbi:aminoglycoside phosphotransferase family protein [Bauldia sp.]|uniref:aminoglycoside phosphotransferase family protein n=1 Tax=Bauldia sp. TaxID=2575872 RepID=UPI003BAAE21C
MDNALTRLTAAWSLTVDGDLIDTPAGRVVFVTHDDRPCVLKLYGPNSDEQDSAAVLAHYGGRGAVRVIARDPDGLLIERAIPGGDLVNLVATGRDDEATAIIADTITALHTANGLVTGLKTIETIGRGFDRFLAGPGDRRLDRPLVERAAARYRDLCSDQASPVVLHGDLHHFNILNDTARGWLAIDPKGMVGEPAYEVGASLRNPITDARLFADPAIIARRVAIYSERLGFDRQRMLDWCFSQAVLSVIWAIEDGWDLDLGMALIEASLPLATATA